MSLSEVAKSISSKAVWQQCYRDKCLSHSWEEGTIGSSWGVGRSVCLYGGGRGEVGLACLSPGRKWALGSVSLRGKWGWGGGEKESAVLGWAGSMSVRPEGVLFPSRPHPRGVPRSAPAPGPVPRRYSRALGALRAHDEAELVDTALGKAVGL